MTDILRLQYGAYVKMMDEAVGRSSVRRVGLSKTQRSAVDRANKALDIWFDQVETVVARTKLLPGTTK